MKDKKIVDYGIGVLFDYGKMVTFGKYLENGQNIGNIFFKMVSKGEQYPLTFDMKEESQTDFKITTQENSTKLSEGRFVDITLVDDIGKPPEFLSNN